MHIGQDNYQTIVHPSYWNQSAENKVFNELDCGRLRPQVSELVQNLSDKEYADLDNLVAVLISERIALGKDLGESLNKRVDSWISATGKKL